MSQAQKKGAQGFSAEERAAMKERAKELKAEARMNKNRADGESALLAAIAEMPEPDRAMATRIHELVSASAPDLMPRTWYGMPAYANKDGKVICYYTAAAKFSSRWLHHQPPTISGGPLPTALHATVAPATSA